VLPKILVIVGPTASGKSALAIKLAKKFGGEIVSADSRQVYKGLDIGTGKVTKREMQGIAHHLLDVANPKRVFNVSEYQKLAYKTIDDILKRGKLSVVVGGTGLFVDSIIKGIVVPEVPPNASLRNKLAKLSNAQMFKLLKRLDPKRAKAIDKNNPRRLMRAIEIATALGKVPALKAAPHYSPIVIGIKLTDKQLRKNISIRLFARIRGGMISEVKQLHTKGVSWKRLFDLGLEYRYVSLYLQGKLTKAQMPEELGTAINQYAKRQWTWFKRDKKIRWLSAAELENWPRLASLPGLRRRVISLGRRS